MVSASKVLKTLENDEFLLYAQPISSTRDLAIVSHEVLLRMPGPKNSLVLPKMFLQEAEHSGLMFDIDCWVAENTVRALEEASARRVVSINVSRATVTRGDNYARHLESLLAGSSLEAGQLEIEIDEEVIVFHIDKSKQFIEDMRRLGCPVLVDDFGGGLSSLYYLKEIDSQEIKIDGQFISGIASSRKDQAIVGAVVDMFHRLDQKVTAEFVSSREAHQMISALGADYAQGSFVGNTVPLQEALQS